MTTMILRAVPCILTGALLAAPSQAQCPSSDDAFEPNDNCYTVGTIGTGLTTGLVLYGAAAPGGRADDHYGLGTQLLAGETLWVEVVATGTGPVELDIDMWRSATAPFPASCTSELGGGNYSGTTYNFGTANPIGRYTNLTGTDVWVIWNVNAISTQVGCVDYSMSVWIDPPACSSGDDVYEDNDTCATAVPFPPSGTSRLQVRGAQHSGGADPDYWSLTLAQGDRLAIQTYFEYSVEDVDVYVYDVTAGCPGNLLDTGATTGSRERVLADNLSGAPMDVVLEVVARDNNISCNDYALYWAVSPSPCVHPDDAYEENDDCATAVALPLGLTTGLWVTGQRCLDDRDYYTVMIPAGERLRVDASFATVNGDVQCELYDVTLGCPGTSIAVATGWQGLKTLLHDNVSGAPLSCVLEVRLGSDDDLNTYDLNVALSPTPCGVDDVFEENDDCTSATPMVPGTYTGLKYFYNGASSLADDDYYSITLQVLETVTIAVHHTTALGSLDIDGYDGTGGCSGAPSVGVTDSAGFDDFTHSWVNTTGAPATFVWRISHRAGTFLCNTYDMTVTLVPNTCSADDVFEDNDTCLTASPLPAGLTTGLQFYYNGSYSNDDEDWYQLDLPAGQDMTLTLDHTVADGGLRLELYRACSGYGTGGTDGIYTITGVGTDTVIATHSNLTSVPATLYLRVSRNSGTFVCNGYSLDLLLVPSTNPCAGIDDSYEDNDLCATAAALSTGLTTGLVVVDEDDDYYSIDVADGSFIDVDVMFLHSEGDIDAWLYDRSGSVCGSYPHLDSDTTSRDGADLRWTNTTGSVVTVAIHVGMATAGDCNDYDLNIYIASGVPGIPFCLGDGSDGVFCPCGNLPSTGSEEGCTNGTGLGSYIVATGVASVSQDTMVLTAHQAAVGEIGVFVQNISTATPMPFYNGALCQPIDSHLVRHYAPPTVMPTHTDATGMGTNAQPMTQGDFLGDTQPGVTIYYQFWYRDTLSCGTGANFSSGRAITWQS